MIIGKPYGASLTGAVVRLEPLGMAHVPDLFAAGGGDDEVWRWLPVPTPRTEDELRALAVRLLERADGGDLLPFAVRSLADDRAIGWTTLHTVPEFDSSVEIGFTWFGRRYWRTAVNTETKLLLLGHAFDDLGYARVLLKTDVLNTRSRAAIARLGAVEEGTLRRQRRRADGSWRDSVFFSWLDDEWPAARDRLRERLARG
jgi:RimJ/RimL family protein N-acetyltransferase